MQLLLLLLASFVAFFVCLLANAKCSCKRRAQLRFADNFWRTRTRLGIELRASSLSCNSIRLRKLLSLCCAIAFGRSKLGSRASSTTRCATTRRSSDARRTANCERSKTKADSKLQSKSSASQLNEKAARTQSTVKRRYFWRFLCLACAVGSWQFARRFRCCANLRPICVSHATKAQDCAIATPRSALQTLKQSNQTHCKQTASFAFASAQRAPKKQLAANPIASEIQVGHNTKRAEKCSRIKQTNKAQALQLIVCP